MLGYEEVREMTAGLVGSYDERICAVGEIIEKSLGMMEQYRNVEKTVENRLKETLAKIESLRKKDFDLLMAPILEYQCQKEQEIKESLNFFLKTQRKLASELRIIIERGVLSEVPKFEKAIQNSINEAKEYLLSFQKGQTLIWENMQSMLCKKEDITLKEFKNTLSSLRGELGLN